MATKRKRRAELTPKKVLVMDFGRYEITGENEKYWLCGWTQFRKTNKHILRVEDVMDAAFENVTESDVPPCEEAGEQEIEIGGGEA